MKIWFRCNCCGKKNILIEEMYRGDAWAQHDWFDFNNFLECLQKKVKDSFKKGSSNIFIDPDDFDDDLIKHNWPPDFIDNWLNKNNPAYKGWLKWWEKSPKNPANFPPPTPPTPTPSELHHLHGLNNPPLNLDSPKMGSHVHEIADDISEFTLEPDPYEKITNIQPLFLSMDNLELAGFYSPQVAVFKIIALKYQGEEINYLMLDKEEGYAEFLISILKGNNEVPPVLEIEATWETRGINKKRALRAIHVKDLDIQGGKQELPDPSKWTLNAPIYGRKTFIFEKGENQVRFYFLHDTGLIFNNTFLIDFKVLHSSKFKRFVEEGLLTQMMGSLSSFEAGSKVIETKIIRLKENLIVEFEGVYRLLYSYLAKERRVVRLESLRSYKII